MVSYKIAEVKSFMAKLLVSTAFDGYILRELELHTFTSFKVSGQFNEDFFSKEELEERNGIKSIFWSELKPIAYSMIKGNKTPLALKIVFQLPPDRCKELVSSLGGRIRAEDIGGLYLNIRFEKGELRIITGTAIKTFIMDKTLEHEWDALAAKTLKEQGIAFEEESA
jgi:hypothetical protein